MICQKPLAPSLADARAMLAACRQAGVPLLVHENWRWQTPIRELKKWRGSTGGGSGGSSARGSLIPTVSRCSITSRFLRELPQFILTDIGTHILDSTRMLLGEARALFCRTRRVHADIRGEDVATVMLDMVSGATVTCEMSYASRVEHDRFPETYIFIEGDQGSLELGPDYWIRATTKDGTLARRYPPPRYAWADPRYDLSQSSGVACNADLLAALQGRRAAETTGEDNLRTLELVFACYASADTGQAIPLNA